MALETNELGAGDAFVTDCDEFAIEVRLLLPRSTLYTGRRFSPAKNPIAYSYITYSVLGGEYDSVHTARFRR